MYIVSPVIFFEENTMLVKNKLRINCLIIVFVKNNQILSRLYISSEMTDDIKNIKYRKTPQT